MKRTEHPEARKISHESDISISNVFWEQIITTCITCMRKSTTTYVYNNYVNLIYIISRSFKEQTTNPAENWITNSSCSF